ncbi:MAG: energy transducer TonB [Bacteroidota bacterium]|jgi:TonB family protein
MIIRLAVTLLSLLFLDAKAQLFEMTSSRNQDLTTKSMRNENVFFTIDTNKMSLKTGDKTYYYEAVGSNFSNGILTLQVLDLKDETVMVKFSSSAKVLDYYLGSYGIRYFLDKVEKPKTEEELAADTIKKELTEEELAARDTMVYESAEVMPQYPGGKQAMLEFLAKNVRFPAQAKKLDVKGFVLVNVTIEKDGSIKHIKVRKDIGGGCGEEAVRVIRLMPAWAPGEDKGETVRVSVPISVSFMQK